MSFKAFVWAWDQDVPNGDYHHVLLALANIAPARMVHASVPYIAKQVRRSPRKVRAAIDWLAEAQVITVTPRPGLVDAIRLNIPPDFHVYMPDEDDDLEVGVRGRPPRKTPAPPAKPSQNPDPRGADEPTEPQEPKSVSIRAPDPFEEWWKVWTPLRRVGKAEARAEFWKAAAKVPMDFLMERTRAYRDHVVGMDPSFIPHPSRWLKNARWDDELTDRSQTDGRQQRAAGIDPGLDRNNARVGAMERGAGAALDRPRRWTFRS